MGAEATVKELPRLGLADALELTRPSHPREHSGADDEILIA
jgi:hypothetical protein